MSITFISGRRQALVDAYVAVKIPALFNAICDACAQKADADSYTYDIEARLQYTSVAGVSSQIITGVQNLFAANGMSITYTYQNGRIRGTVTAAP